MDYGLRSIGYGERLLPKSDITLCEQFVLIGSGMIWNIYFAFLALLFGFLFSTVLALGKNSSHMIFNKPSRIFIFILKLFCSGTLSMMNIRDYFLINKTKKVNKIKILDLLGFESDTLIEASSYSEEATEVVEDLNQETFETLLNNTEEIYVEQSSIESYIASSTEPTNVADLTPTDTFNPLNITEQIQRVWSDLESRRKWVLPAFISISMVFVTNNCNKYLFKLQE